MITRDGSMISLWQGTSAPYQIKNTLFKDERIDVIIVGGGITGISTALRLQECGKKCLVLEANDLCFGTTGGTTAHLNTLLDTPYTTIINNFGRDEARKIAGAAADAIQSVKVNSEKYRIDCDFQFCNAYLFSKDQQQSDELSKIYDSLEAVGVLAQYTETSPFPIDFQEAITVDGQAKFNPVRYVHGLANAYETAGGVIKTNCRVTNFSESKDKVEVETETGIYYCSKLIFATHIPPFVNLLHLRCAPYRSYAMAIELAGDEYPEDLAYDMYDPYHYYRSQIIDGNKYMIIGGKDHKTAQESNTNASFLHLESHIRSYFNIKKIAYAWSSQYYESTDGIPYIGQLPGSSEHVLVATGFGGNGMIYSNVAAQVLTSIIFQEDNDLIDMFRPSRVKPVAGFKNFADHNFDALKNFIGKFFATEEFRGLADLAPGDSKIVKIEHQAIGIHKDEQGGLHAVNATCTHMKCTVVWNSGEKSWDCPCHGGRFSCDGKVLTGPPTRDLDYVNIELVVADTHS